MTVNIIDTNPTIVAVEPQSLALFKSSSVNTISDVTITVTDEDSNENEEVYNTQTVYYCMCHIAV